MGENHEEEAKEKKEEKKGRKGARNKRKAQVAAEEETTPTKTRRLSAEEKKGEDESPLRDAPAQTLSTVEKMDLDGQEEREGEEEELDIASQLVKELGRKDNVVVEGEGAKAGEGDNKESHNSGEQGGEGGESKAPSGPVQPPGKFSIAKVLAHAIGSSAEKKMTLNSIYTWFTEAYPVYVTTNENTWKARFFLFGLFPFYLFSRTPKNQIVI